MAGPLEPRDTPGGIRMADPAALLSQIEVPHMVRSVILDGPGTDHDYFAYLEAVDRLHVAVKFIEEELRNGRLLISKAMETIKTDFWDVLTESSLFPDLDELRESMLSDESSEHIAPPEVLAAMSLKKLHAIARRMIANDMAHACTKTYIDARSAALRRNFERLGAPRVTLQEVKDMAWPRLEEKMRRWSEHMHMGMILIAGEREACDTVFDSLDPYCEQCFVDLSRGPFLLLTNFGADVAEIDKAPERLFSFLDMYETALDLLNTAEELYRGVEGDSLRQEYKRMLEAVGGAARQTFEKFEQAVKEQPAAEEGAAGGGSVAGAGIAANSAGLNGVAGRHEGRIKGQGGFFRGWTKGKKKDDLDTASVVPASSAPPSASSDVHPLTSYVVNYLLLLCNNDLPYFSILEAAFENVTSMSGDLSAGLVRPHVQGKLAFATARILDALKSNLEQRAGMLRDDMLGEIFLINNLAYVLTKMDSSDAGRLLGAAWIGNYGSTVETHRDKFIAITVSKFDPVWTMDRLDAASIVKRAKLFNTTLDSLRQRQQMWSIANKDLREHVRRAVVRRVMEKYLDFLSKHGAVLRGSKAYDVKVYSGDEVELMLSDSFTGSPTASRGSRHSSAASHLS